MTKTQTFISHRDDEMFRATGTELREIAAGRSKRRAEEAQFEMDRRKQNRQFKKAA